MATQEERKKRTRDKLINSARNLFESKGFEATLIDNIIKLANVAKGTFYQHFNTKLEILMAIERESNSEITLKALKSISNGKSALKVLDEYLESLGNWFEKREKIAEAMVIHSLTRDRDKNDESPLSSSRGFIYNVLTSAKKQKLIRDDIDLWELADMIGGFIIVSVLKWIKKPQPNQLDEILKRLLKILLQGIQNKDNL